MSYSLEYHNDEKTVDESREARKQWIAEHMAKYLGMWPEEVRSQMAQHVKDNLVSVYGEVEYLVKAIPQDNEGYSEWLENLTEFYGGKVVQPIETAPDKAWVRLTFGSGDEAEQAKQQIG